MFNKSKLSILCATFALALMAPIASFAVVIDDFQTGEYTVGREGTPMPYTVSDMQMDPSGTHILGGQRDVTFEKLTGSSTQPYATLNTAYGASYNSSFGCNAIWSQHYGMNGDLNSDFTNGGGTALMVNILGGDMGGPFPRPTPFSVTLISGSGAAQATHTISLTADGTYFLDFSDFPGVDMTDIDQVFFTVTQSTFYGNDAIDFAMDFFGTDSDMTVSTEETTWDSLKANFR